MALVYHSARIAPGPWIAAFKEKMPELDVRVWPEVGNAEDVKYLFSWLPPQGAFERLPNLKLLQVFGAGADQLFNGPAVPQHIAIARLVDPYQTAGMVSYVLASVLFYHRHFDRYAQRQAKHAWTRDAFIDTSDRKIGVMGLGVLGAAAAEALAAQRFDVAGWSRTPRNLEGVRQYTGTAELDAFLGRTEILVNLLPLTPETKGILNASLFAKLPEAARVINAGRGAHCVEADLIAALDSGHLGGAMLDVFAQEPLPAENPLWSHAGVRITPHIATDALPRSAVDLIVENIRRVESGRPLLHGVDRDRRY